MGRPRRISIAVGLLCLVMAGTWYAHYKWERRYFVPVGVPTSLNRYDDDTPVTTTLHEYADFGSSDETTGKSISFTFPRSLYTFASNARGGPQRRIGISIDRVTLDRVDTSAELQKLRPTIPHSNAYVLANLHLRNLDIWIHTNQNHWFQSIYPRIERARSKRTIAPIASFCGLSWYLERDVRGRTNEANPKFPPTSPGPNFGYGADLLATIDGAFVGGEPASAYCNMEGGYCHIYASFEDWPLSFRILRGQLCEWPTELKRVRSFLENHVSGRTSRRPVQPE